MSKPAAIWARVSTTGQAETSLPNQVSRCKDILEKSGYSVIREFSVDWTSLDLYSCPDFQQLRNMIKNREIEALGVFDRDRLEAKGLQRLIFLSELKDSKVELIICQGPPVIEGPEGQIVELALAIGKERQVMRARQGSKDGLHDRVLKGKPATWRNPYGYKWDKDNFKLIPDNNYPVIKLIFNMLLKGSGYTPIIKELNRRNIPGPGTNLKKQTTWGKVAISQFIHNPIYAGRYFGLKKSAVEPKSRRPKTNSYGNSSVKVLPLDQAHYMPHIEIIDPPITWEQRAIILDQLVRHQKLAQRHAKRDYLLRGMIYCEVHRGQNGEPRAYHGQPHHDTWRYTCSVGGCENDFINGPVIERFIKQEIGHVFNYTNEEFFKLLANKDNLQKQREQNKAELEQLDKAYATIIDNMAELEDRHINRQVENEVYLVLNSQYQMKRTNNRERRDSLIDELAQLHRYEQAVESWQDLKKRFLSRLDYEPETLMDKAIAGYTDSKHAQLVAYLTRSDKKPQIIPDVKPLSQSEWRDLLTTLNFSLHVNKTGTPTFTDNPDGTRIYNPLRYEFDIEDLRIHYRIQDNPKYLVENFKKIKKHKIRLINLSFKLALPLLHKAAEGIVKASPGNELRNKQYYPLHLSLLGIIPKKVEASIKE